MTREVEVAIALILIPIAAFCLWDFSYVTGAVASAIVLGLSIGLYMHSERRGASLMRRR
jgi:hypothetical protein